MEASPYFGVGEDAGLAPVGSPCRHAESVTAMASRGRWRCARRRTAGCPSRGRGVGIGRRLGSEAVGRVPIAETTTTTVLPARRVASDDVPGDAPHRVDVADGRAAVLLDDQCHGALPVLESVRVFNQVLPRRCGRRNPAGASGIWSRRRAAAPTTTWLGQRLRCAVLPTYHVP